MVNDDDDNDNYMLVWFEHSYYSAKIHEELTFNVCCSGIVYCELCLFVESKITVVEIEGCLSDNGFQQEKNPITVYTT